MGLVKGVGANSFAPYNSITRQDVCTMLYRYLTEYMSYDLTASTGKFKDDEYIADYASTAVYCMKKIGVVQGDNNGNFNPTAPATRAEIAIMFSNLYQWMNR